MRMCFSVQPNVTASRGAGKLDVSGEADHTETVID